MKLIVQYTTTESMRISEHVSQPVSREIEIEALEIIRLPRGRKGRNMNRYHYEAIAKAPDDARFADADEGLMRVQINRKANPHFKPLMLTFERDRWTPQQ